ALFTNSSAIRTVLLCSGKIYYELLERQERDKREDVALVRIEQLYPLRLDLLGEALALYPAAADYCWVQEEPANMGAWSFIRWQIAGLIGREPRFVGRREDASPAVGSHRVHKQEQEKLLNEAFAP
ncbi:MAG TPA: 2-oxoglutarate dehydrogenase E1 component, partial [Geobacteraceae bacterium]